jgi:hypothetical protein
MRTRVLSLLMCLMPTLALIAAGTRVLVLMCRMARGMGSAVER